MCHCDAFSIKSRDVSQLFSGGVNDAIEHSSDVPSFNQPKHKAGGEVLWAIRAWVIGTCCPVPVDVAALGSDCASSPTAAKDTT
jgi:hypothetical protein